MASALDESDPQTDNAPRTLETVSLETDNHLLDHVAQLPGDGAGELSGDDGLGHGDVTLVSGQEGGQDADECGVIYGGLIAQKQRHHIKKNLQHI